MQKGESMGWIKSVKEEIAIIRERDPAIHSSMEVFLYPSFKVMLHYRVAHALYKRGHFFWARFISQRAVFVVPVSVVRGKARTLPREEMNHCDLPDPVREDITNLQRANTELTNRLLDMELQLKRMQKGKEV